MLIVFDCLFLSQIIVYILMAAVLIYFAYKFGKSLDSQVSANKAYVDSFKCNRYVV